METVVEGTLSTKFHDWLIQGDNINVIAEYFNANSLTINKGACEFNSNGSGSVAKGNIRWDADGNVTYQGKEVLGNINSISVSTSTTDIEIDASSNTTFYYLDFYAFTQTNIVSKIKLKGHSIGARIKLYVYGPFLVNNYHSRVLLYNNENKTLQYTFIKTVVHSEGSTSEVKYGGRSKGMTLSTGCYELVAISEDKWLVLGASGIESASNDKEYTGDITSYVI